MTDTENNHEVASSANPPPTISDLPGGEVEDAAIEEIEIIEGPNPVSFGPTDKEDDEEGAVPDGDFSDATVCKFTDSDQASDEVLFIYKKVTQQLSNEDNINLFTITPDLALGLTKMSLDQGIINVQNGMMRDKQKFEERQMTKMMEAQLAVQKAGGPGGGRIPML